MKKTVFLLLFTVLAVAAHAQEYTIRSAGQGKSGNYLVEVTVLTKKKTKNLDAESMLKQYAVHGVMFRGFMASDGYAEQKPLIADPAVEQTKAEFFEAFNAEGQYKRFASIVDTSLSITKLPKKQYEVTGILLVDKESLLRYLEEAGIVKGFSNLW